MKCSIQGLTEWLDHRGYSLLLQSATGGHTQNPWEERKLIEQKYPQLEHTERQALQLFYIGDHLSAAETEKMLGPALIARLVESQILFQSSAGYSLGGRTILVYGGLYVLADIWRAGSEAARDLVYIGDDSFFLAKALPVRPRDRVLEIGCGTGIQSLIAAQRGATVLAVDINERAVTCAGLNASINGLSHLMRVCHGDMYEAAGNEQFDLIIADPPFLPYVDHEGALFADGGEDGLKLVKRILHELPSHLLPHGRALMFAGSFGNDGGPSFAEEIRDFARVNSLEITLFVASKKRAAEHVAEMRAKHPSLAGGIREMSPQRVEGFSHYFTWLMWVRKATESSVRVIHAASSFADRLKASRSRISDGLESHTRSEAFGSRKGI